MVSWGHLFETEPSVERKIGEEADELNEHLSHDGCDNSERNRQQADVQGATIEDGSLCWNVGRFNDQVQSGRNSQAIDRRRLRMRNMVHVCVSQLVGTAGRKSSGFSLLKTTNG